MNGTRVAAAVVLAALLGCTGEEPIGPTTQAYEQQREALKARSAEKSRRKAPTEVAQATETEPGVSGFGATDRSFVYDPQGKRDPFRNFKWERPDRLRTDSTRGPLEQFDLGQLSLVAVVWKTGSARALVQDPSGESYIIAEGARIGKNEGRVIAIEDNLVLVKETYVDFLGQRTTKDIEMRMRRNEGG